MDQKDLIDRLHTAVALLDLKHQVSEIFFDTEEDIVTIQLHIGVDKIQFYTAVESTDMLKKDDQITISWI